MQESPSLKPNQIIRVRFLAHSALIALSHNISRICYRCRRLCRLQDLKRIWGAPPIIGHTNLSIGAFRKQLYST